jgi:hypothetical protein
VRDLGAECRAVAELDRLAASGAAVMELLQSAAAAGETWLALAAQDRLTEIAERADVLTASLTRPCRCCRT